MSRMMAEIRPQNQSGEAPLLPPLPPKAPLYCCQAPSTVVTKASPDRGEGDGEAGTPGPQHR